jgi:hypothetical protein
MVTIEQVKNYGWLIFEAIVGSKAYGLDTTASDTDIRGVYILPKEYYYSMEYMPQVSNETNDFVYYELKRFLELLLNNNPNILELLNLPESCLLKKDPIMDMVDPALFLSKLCEQSFANYAYTQIKKAYGLEKKIMNPVDQERKPVLDFCFVYEGKEAIPLRKFLEKTGFRQEDCGLSAISHMRDCYNLYHSKLHSYAGVIKKEQANDVCLSSVPKGEKPVGLLYFNKDGYSVYCKQYREYWDWVDRRNEVRYNTTMAHGKRYDSKNMMHVFRLLYMAREIAIEGKINVWRKDRDFLLDVKAGKYEYDELLAKAEGLKSELPELYQQSILSERPDEQMVNRLLINMRETWYEK